MADAALEQLTPVATARSATTALPNAVFAFGFLLPILAGGNTFFELQPENGLALFIPVAMLAMVTTFANPAAARPMPVVQTGSLLLLAAWWLGSYFARSAGPRAGLEALALALAVLLHLAFLWRPLDPAAMRRLILGLVAGTVVTALYAQYQYWIVYPRIAPHLAASGRGLFTSVNANFYSGNCYAPFLAGVGILGVAVARSAESMIARSLVTVALTLLAFVLFLTGSRATITLAAAVAGFAWLARRSWFSARATFLGIAIAVAAAGVTSVVTDWSELLRYGIQGRIAVWRGALAMIAAEWPVGVGLGGFAESFYKYRVTDYYTRYPHNLMLEVTAELGIVGGLALAVFLVTSLVGAAGALRADGPLDEGSRLRAAAALAAMLLAAHAMLDIDWHAPANVLLLLVLLAAARTSSTEGQR